MNLEIINKEKNDLLGRAEIKFEVKADKTPSRKELKKKIAALTNSKEELIIVDKIKQEFGFHKTTGLAKIYVNRIELEKTEPKYLLNRNEGKKEEKKEEVKTAKVEEKKVTEPEKPKEETKEKPKEEVKEKKEEKA
ncbi:MAG: 30S ribosomal protein S24e [archaeon]